jgi:hypothetical protein
VFDILCYIGFNGCQRALLVRIQTGKGFGYRRMGY